MVKKIIYTKVIGICYENNRKHTNTLLGQNKILMLKHEVNLLMPHLSFCVAIVLPFMPLLHAYESHVAVPIFSNP
jgi:hypothetical protein